MRGIREFIREEDGVGVVELILILAPILLGLFAVHDLLKGIGVICTPIVLGRGEGNIGSNAEHVNVVADAEYGFARFVFCLNSGGCAGGVRMLTDDDAAACHECVCGFALFNEIEPLFGVLNVHMSLGNDGTDAEEECGVAGNNFCIGVCADVADVGIGNFAFVHERLELHARNDAGNIACFVDAVKIVENVVKLGMLCSLLTGCVAENNVGILFCGADEVILMTEGVRDDELAALFREVDCCFIALFVLGDVVFVDDLIIAEVASFFCGLNALNVCVGVAFVFVADENCTDFEI